MINVYAWPPVGVVGSEWTEEAPIQRSRSLLTGKDYISTYARKRRLATLAVSALSLDRAGAGYTEMLKRFLDGGIHAVRLYSYPINWWLDAQMIDPQRRSDRLPWETQGNPLPWTCEAQPLHWYTGTVIYGDVVSGGAVSVSGLPPKTLVARAGDFVVLYEDADDALGTSGQVIRSTYSDADGNATIDVLDALPAWTGVRVSVGGSATGVFRPISMPRSVQPLNANWTYQWGFREVFADEVGGFTEIDPWR